MTTARTGKTELIKQHEAAIMRTIELGKTTSINHPFVEDLHPYEVFRNNFFAGDNSARYELLKAKWYEIIKTKCPQWVVTEDEFMLVMRIVNHTIARYIPDMPSDLNPHKGIFLYGSIGVGKSTLIESIAHLTHFIRHVLEYRDYERVHTMSEADYFTTCKNEVLTYQATKNGEIRYALLYNQITFDELGREPKTVKHMGNPINLFSYIIDERNRLYVKAKANKRLLITNFSSNIDMSDNGVTFSKMYGEEIYDRLKQMCEIVEWIGESKR